MNRPDMRNIKYNIERQNPLKPEQSQQMYDYIMFLEKKNPPQGGGLDVQEYYTGKIRKKEPVFFSEKQYLKFNTDGSIEGENEMGKFSISADGIIRILNNQKRIIKTELCLNYAQSLYYGLAAFYYPIKVESKNILVKPLTNEAEFVATIDDICKTSCSMQVYGTSSGQAITVGYALVAYKEHK